MREAITIAILVGILLVLILVATGRVRTTFVARPAGITARGVIVVFAVFALTVLVHVGNRRSRADPVPASYVTGAQAEKCAVGREGAARGV